MEVVYTKAYHVELSDVDYKKQLKLSALFEYFQDIANLAASALGFGIDRMSASHNVAWVLTGMRSEVVRMPQWNEDISIETWPLEHGKLSFERDYIVRDATNHVIVTAASSWVVIDLTTRELRKADFIGFKLQSDDRPRALDAKLVKIRPVETINHIYDKAIGYSDIDLYGHINNSRYVSYAMDCFDLAHHNSHNLRSVQIDYLNEALAGDTLHLGKSVLTAVPDTNLIEGVSSKSGKAVFRARLSFEPAS